MCRSLTLLLSVLLCVTALVVAAGVAAAPAVAGIASGNVYDAYQNPLGGILVEALDSVTGVPIASATTSPGAGDFSFELVSPATGVYKVRISDPAGIFTTTYYSDRSTFEAADLVGYT
jgi:hypothetical protein